jgi:farnesyl diphosphate synthase
VATDSALRGFLEQCQRRVEAALEQRLPPATVPPTRLHEAMRYAVLGAGKRVRPVLVYAAGGALGVPPESLDDAACAVELVHAYSLVHDDLPAMDDDDLRRGRPTCHRAYDEATAILVGDALQTLAFQVLCDEPTDGAAAATRLAMVRTLAAASGSRGMAGGQSLDLDAVGRELTLAELEQLHIHKTGALIRASVLMAAHCGPGLGPDAIAALGAFGDCVGLAFQVQDDILDIEGDVQVIGKPPGSDEARGMPTYPAIAGLDAARTRVSGLHEEAIRQLAAHGWRDSPLADLSHWLLTRNR